MIHELAVFENAADSVLATEASLSHTLSFAPSAHGQPTQAAGYAKTFILTAPEGGIAGMALFFHNYSTWRAAPGIYLEDLFIRPAYRRRGYATVLLKELAQEVVRIGGARLEWSCLKWNTSALTFYRSLGAETRDEWVGLRVDGEALKKLAEKEVNVKSTE
jgi:GNAT superfamily N-acetyltransferase